MIEITQILRTRTNIYSILSRLFYDHLDTENGDPEYIHNRLSQIVTAENPSLFSYGEKLNITISKIRNTVLDLCEYPDRTLQVQREYALLFLLPNGVHPCESIYLDFSKLMRGKPWHDVREFYRKNGLAAAEEEHHPEDHIAVELGFMSMAPFTQDAFETSALSEQKKFMDEHLLLWGFDLAESIISHPSASFYRITGELLYEWLKYDNALLEKILNTNVNKHPHSPETFNVRKICHGQK